MFSVNSHPTSQPCIVTNISAKIRIVYIITIVNVSFYALIIEKKQIFGTFVAVKSIVMIDKSEIRREVRRRIKELSPEHRALSATKIFTQIEQTSPFKEAECIALFASMKDEVSTEYALKAWLEMGKHIVVPRVEGDIMRFYDYSPERMQTGAFGIEEPIGEVEFPAEKIDLMIVPARAFTRNGERLGRGGGFYDKYMSLSGFRAYKIGIAYSVQIFDSLPCDAHDIRVDEVVTE